MDWNELFGGNRQPTYEDIENYIGGEGLALWKDLFAYMRSAYGAAPKMTYSGCSGKPGWNVKFQKGGVSFGTLYPEENAFSVFTVLSYKLNDTMELLKPELSPAMRERYENAPDYMKMGKCLMFGIAAKTDLDDYKVLMSAKKAPKVVE